MDGGRHHRRRGVRRYPYPKYPAEDPASWLRLVVVWHSMAYPAPQEPVAVVQSNKHLVTVSNGRRSMTLRRNKIKHIRNHYRL